MVNDGRSKLRLKGGRNLQAATFDHEGQHGQDLRLREAELDAVVEKQACDLGSRGGGMRHGQASRELLEEGRPEGNAEAKTGAQKPVVAVPKFGLQVLGELRRGEAIGALKGFTTQVLAAPHERSLHGRAHAERDAALGSRVFKSVVEGADEGAIVLSGQQGTLIELVLLSNEQSLNH